MKKITAIIFVLILVSLFGILVTGCGKKEELPSVESIPETQTMNVLQFSATEQENSGIGQPEIVKTIAENDDNFTQDNPESKYSTLEEFFRDNQELGNNLCVATGGVLLVQGDTMEFIFDVTGLKEGLIESGYNLLTTDYTQVVQLISCDNWDSMVFVQRYFSKLIGHEITVKTSYYIYDRLMFTRDYTQQTQYLPDTDVIRNEIEKVYDMINQYQE